MIPYYSEKVRYLREHQGGCCPIAMDKKGERQPVTEMHHKLVHKTKRNIKHFPLLIDSLLNLILANHDMHMSWPSWGKISDYQAYQIEHFLERHPRMASFVNTVS